MQWFLLSIYHINVFMSCRRNHTSMNGLLIYQRCNALRLWWDVSFQVWMYPLQSGLSLLHKEVEISHRPQGSRGHDRPQKKNRTKKPGWILYLHVRLTSLFYERHHSSDTCAAPQYVWKGKQETRKDNSRKEEEKTYGIVQLFTSPGICLTRKCFHVSVIFPKV